MPCVYWPPRLRLYQACASPPDNPASLPSRPWLPPVTLSEGASPPPCTPWRVKIWITPPIASAPYRLERGPRTISMRSICSTGICSSEASPAVTEPIRTPSISTSVWVELVPRRNSEVCAPSPPAWAKLTPGSPVSRSATEIGCNRWMSARVITVTEDSASSTVMAVRVAVTITGARLLASPWSAACATWCH